MSLQALPTTPPPAKKSRLEATRDEPVLVVPMVQVLPSDVVRPYQELVVRPPLENTCPVGNEASAATSSGNAMEKDAPDIPSS